MFKAVSRRAVSSINVICKKELFTFGERTLTLYDTVSLNLTIAIIEP